VAALCGAEERPRSPGIVVLDMGVGSSGLDPDDVPIGCPTESRSGGLRCVKAVVLVIVEG
jgi:hypothetical protein